MSSEQSNADELLIGLVATIARYRLALEVIAACDTDYERGGGGMIAVAAQALKHPEGSRS